jgi:hypothetical protein
MFAGLKKKKKKKKKVEEEEEQVEELPIQQQQTPNQSTTEIDQIIPETETIISNATTTPSANVEDLDQLFGDLKKKKKKKKVFVEELLDGEEDSKKIQNINQEISVVSTTESIQDDEFVGLKKKVKGSKRPNYQDFEALLQEQQGGNNKSEVNVFNPGDDVKVNVDDAWVGTNRDYTYDEVNIYIYINIY